MQIFATMKRTLGKGMSGKLPGGGGYHYGLIQSYISCERGMEMSSSVRMAS